MRPVPFASPWASAQAADPLPALTAPRMPERSGPRPVSTGPGPVPVPVGRTPPARLDGVTPWPRAPAAKANY